MKTNYVADEHLDYTNKTRNFSCFIQLSTYQTENVHRIEHASDVVLVLNGSILVMELL